VPPNGKRIYTKSDGHGPVEVFDDGACRYLSFGDDDEQSCVLTREPHIPQLDYIRAMLLPLLYRRPKDVTLLGLGAGSLATCLHRRFRALTLRAVELRPLVIEVAQRFFGLPQSPRLQPIAQDAFDYLRTPALAPTDLLLCDLYDAQGMDERCFDADFIAACAGALSDKGWLVLNCWEEHRDDSDTLTLLASHFAEIHTCTVASGNWLLFASRRRNRIGQALLLERAQRLSDRLEFDLLAPLAGLYPIYSGPEPE
jgi:spermidine synthase